MAAPRNGALSLLVVQCSRTFAQHPASNTSAKAFCESATASGIRPRALWTSACRSERLLDLLFALQVLEGLLCPGFEQTGQLQCVQMEFVAGSGRAAPVLAQGAVNAMAAQLGLMECVVATVKADAAVSRRRACEAGAQQRSAGRLRRGFLPEQFTGRRRRDGQ